ncbi:MAG: dihydrofolate reductase family protein, partial [Alistipes sp.]|nr:dihydrofolate reductase family protein [Alistipes sp.]
MRVTLSYAVSSDGYLDDCTPQRLILSTPEDWQAVYRLRASQDAILIGAETLRRDNPSLKLVPTRVVISRSGALDPEARFFTVGEARRIVF